MTDDAKEWVTIKVPETVRDDAREDPRTYGEIMRAGTEGAPDFDLEQEALFERLSGVEDVLGQNNIQREEFRVQLEEMQETLERIESSASTVEERTGRIEQALEDMGARR
jgi:archaellum component FlaC